MGTMCKLSDVHTYQTQEVSIGKHKPMIALQIHCRSKSSKDPILVHEHQTRPSCWSVQELCSIMNKGAAALSRGPEHPRLRNQQSV